MYNMNSISIRLIIGAAILLAVVDNTTAFQPSGKLSRGRSSSTLRRQYSEDSNSDNLRADASRKQTTTSFGADNVPVEQRPSNEYLNLIQQPTFGWASQDSGDIGLGLRLVVLYAFLFGVVCYPISGAKDWEEEGCLSFPDMRGDVERSKWIKVEAQNMKGKKIKKKYKGWEARIFQHEYDHLDGTVYIDRLTEEGRANVQVTLEELVSNYGEGGAL